VRRRTARGLTARGLTVGALALSALPTLAGVALVRPAAAAGTPPFARFGLTTIGAAVTSSGTIAAGGGLLLTDQGAAAVTGRLDSSPSSRTMAVAGEPGTTLRTLSASMGGPPAPGAAAQYPGGPDSSSDPTVGTTNAHATMLAADGAASAATSGDGTGDAASASERLTRDASGAALAASVTSDSGTLTIAGVLALGSVVGTASVGYDGQHRPPPGSRSARRRWRGSRSPSTPPGCTPSASRRSAEDCSPPAVRRSRSRTCSRRPVSACRCSRR